MSEFCDCRVVHEERVKKARAKALAPEETESLALFFKALGDPTRLHILGALLHEEMCVCDLAAFLGVSESAVSHQLRTLRQLQLVANRREGPILYYRINDAHVDTFLALALEHLRE